MFAKETEAIHMAVDYKKLIIKMVEKIDNKRILIAIYTYIKTLME